MNLHGTIALVTGGAKRVGRAIVHELAAAGCDTAIHCLRSRKEADALASDIAASGRRAVVVAGDLNDPATWPRIIQKTVESLSGLNILVNNASMFPIDQSDTLEDFDTDRAEAVFRVNLTAPLALSHHAMPHLKRAGGIIVNLCDAVSDRPHPNHLVYGVSKAALVALTRGLARAAAPNVRVIGVAPGIAAFPTSYTEAQRDDLLRSVPMRRAGTPDDVARLVRVLVESADYLTGQVVALDGGRSTV